MSEKRRSAAIHVYPSPEAIRMLEGAHGKSWRGDAAEDLESYLDAQARGDIQTSLFCADSGDLTGDDRAAIRDEMSRAGLAQLEEIRSIQLLDRARGLARIDPDALRAALKEAESGCLPPHAEPAKKDHG